MLTSVNTRLLIQNMRLPTHDMFTTLLHDFMNLRIFCLQFASGEKKDLWIPDFWYKMWDCPPMFSRTLNSEYWIFSKSFDLFTTLLYDFTIFLFTICRWGKERPLNTRLLIQNVGLPTHDIDSVPGLEGNEGTSSDRLGSNEEAPWEVQVFRSITSDSARFVIVHTA